MSPLLRNVGSKLLLMTQQPELQGGAFFAVTVVLVIAYWQTLAGSWTGGFVVFLFGVAFTKRIAMGKGIPAAAEKRDMSGLQCIVTGANTGIGKQTALQLAQWGANVTIACRDIGKGKEAAEAILAVAKEAKVDVMPLDLSSFASIKAFAALWKARPSTEISVLINNAGVMNCPFRLTSDGIEMQFGTNHVGHFLLTKLLLPFLADDGRVINLSSVGHMFAPAHIKWNRVSDPTDYSPARAYGISKLANIYFTRELQKRMPELRPGSQITCYSVHPGVVRTELIRHVNSYLAKNWNDPITWLFMKSAMRGAQTSLYCAVAPLKDLEPGQYYWDCQSGSTTIQGRDMEEARLLWDETEALIHPKSV